MKSEYQRRWVLGSGGGGKGGGGSTPVEAPDSLRSKQLARIVEIVSEGEIEGLVGGLKGVYFNDTPVQNSDGSFNFSDVSLVPFNGALSQSYIPGFTENESEQSSGSGLPVAVKVSPGPIIRTVPARSGSGADAVRVTIGIPGLSKADTSNGNINGTSVQIRIEVQHNGGGYVTKIDDTISGKTTSRYQKSYRISLPQSETGPWDIKVSRITPDASDSSLVNETWWDSYTIITESKMQFRNSAGFGLELDSSLFSSVPSRGYHIKGLRVRIPSNYDPIARTYTGIWDGTFKTEWTNNPAWCWFDLVTHPRYGMGKFIQEDQIDKWSLYNIAQYCDELVPDGYGSLEPRFTCNLFLQTREDAFNVILNMASIFRAIVWGSAGGITIVQDAPSDPIALFTNANVIGGNFNYGGGSLRAQHTVALVTWNDPADMYRQKIEYVEDEDSVRKFGIIPTEVVAFGCTSRGQANRFGQAIILAEKMESDTVSFSAGLDTTFIYPGAVFETADITRSLIRNGGRLLSATVSNIQLDSPVTLDSGQSYTVKVVLPSGDVESRSVTSTGSDLTSLSVSPDFSEAPQNMAIWILSSTDMLTEKWVAIGVAEDSSDTGSGVTYSVSAKAYHEKKFALIDDGKPLPLIPEYNPYALASGAINLNARVYTNQDGTTDLLISWEEPKFTREAKLTWYRANDVVYTDKTAGTSYTIKNVTPGIYSVYVTLTNNIGVAANPTAISVDTTTARTLAAPSNLTRAFRDGLVVVSWKAVADGQRLVTYEVRKGTNFLTALRLGVVTSTEFYTFGDGVYWVRAVSYDTLVTSPAVSITITGSEVFRNVVASFDEAGGGWTGSTTAPGYISAGSLKVLNGTTTYTPDAAHEVDVGTEQLCRCIAAYYVLAGSDVLFSTIPLVSAVTSFIGSFSDSVSAKIEMAIAGSDGVYGPWQEYFPGSYMGRKFKFRANLTSSAADVTAVMSQFTTTVDMPDRFEAGNNVAVADTGLTVSFATPYQQVPNVQITLINGVAGDHVALSPPTINGFTVQVINSGVGVARNINWLAQGF